MLEPTKLYEDHLGTRVPYDGRGPIAWRVSVYAIAIRDSALLMVEPVWAQRWELPGGGVELQTQESLADAAQRECWEETGYEFTPTEEPRLVGEAFFLLRDPDRYCHSLLCAIRGLVSDHPDPDWQRDPNEISAVQWIPLETLTDRKIHRPHKDALHRLDLI